MTRLHCPTLRQTETEKDTDTNKLAYNLIEICVGAYRSAVWTPPRASRKAILSVSVLVLVSGSVNTP